MTFLTDLDKMNVAIDEARKGGDLGEVPVGAALFLGDQLIASAHNLKESMKSATAHAEILTIEKACKVFGDWRLLGTSLFVTAEPCFMCAGAILQSRIPTVHFGVKEPKFGGVESCANLFNIPQTNHQVTYSGGLCHQEIAELMADFFKKLRKS